jgi:hypothetical protein
MKDEEWLQELRTAFADPVAMMSSTKRSELKINGWDLNQIAVVVLGDRRKTM